VSVAVSVSVPRPTAIASVPVPVPVSVPVSSSWRPTAIPPAARPRRRPAPAAAAPPPAVAPASAATRTADAEAAAASPCTSPQAALPPLLLCDRLARELRGVLRLERLELLGELEAADVEPPGLHVDRRQRRQLLRAHGRVRLVAVLQRELAHADHEAHRHVVELDSAGADRHAHR
jgi:hypothetical protein